MLCPCGSELEFSLCCQPLIKGVQTASSPEKLMRSRYSAYATGEADYIYQTYAKTSRAQQNLEEIAQWAAMTKWLFLEIHHSSEIPQSAGELPVVKFSAHYLLGNKYHKMTETSRFLQESGQWRYLDGDVSDSDEVREIKRNDACPCRSKKKFKQCCGR
ncbi:SEC-C domain-containing protein [Thalassomonas viridans]|uniref:SEC-C domain-containing protein n=1 Tax=Thalassomonas viridans TaxID=137584 RepID=A0AAE9Z7Q3_9GAMM|nr:YchJ family metal-binding protein [Thalassomonas viridans]WDE07674.1 SEC-C domain-containing protein [Thalassomonas viridans]